MLANDYSKNREQLLRELKIRDLQNRLKESESRVTREQEEHYQLLFELAPVGYIILNEDGKVIESNQTVQDLLNITPEELQGALFYKFIRREYRDQFFLHLRQLKGESQTAAIEIPFLHLGTEERWMSVRTIRFHREDAKLFRIALIDITEQKEYEQQLMESYRTIRQMSRHLENVREEERKHLARELHDEFGQNLTAIHLDLQLLERQIERKDQEQIQHIIEKITKSVVELANFSKKLSREIRPELIETTGLLSTLQWQLDQFQQRTGIHYELKATSEQFGLTDKMALTVFRVFQEALANIGRHSGTQKVRVALSEKKGTFRMEVRDYGKGFDMAHQGNHHYGIMGMKERILQWNGEVSVESIPGKGTTVTIQTPINNL